MNIDLRNKVAIVTGAGRGIGLEIALTLAGEGVKTIATDISASDLKTVYEKLAAMDYDGQAVVCDVTNSRQIQEVMDYVLDHYGRVDILVNNAGIGTEAAVETLTEENWDRHLDINLKGTFLMSKAVIPIMKKQKSGRIINSASFASIIPRCYTAAYAASKAGIVHFTRVLASELGPWNITVNAYAPGMVSTDMNHFDSQPREVQDRLLETLTLRRWGSKRDVANLVCFLASDLAGYITGTLIDVSGGKFATQDPWKVYEQFPGKISC